MATPEKTIAQAAARQEDHRRQLVGAAVQEYFVNMPERRFPRRDELDAADQRARVCLRRGMWKPQWLSDLMEEPFDNEDSIEALKLAFMTQTHPMHAPLPPAVDELQPRMLGYAAGIGAGLAIMLVMLAGRILTPNSPLNFEFVVAAPLGAFAMVLFIAWISRHGRLRRLLQGALGVATVVEVWMAVTGTVSPMRAIWGRLGNRHPHWSLLKRLATYVLLILLLELSVRRPAYYRDEHEKLVRSAVDQWLDGAVRLQAAMCLAAYTAPGGSDTEERLAGLARHLYTLHDSTCEELPVSAAELLQEARNAGFERLEGEPSFLGGEAPDRQMLWRPEMHRLYETFGRIEDGDPVRIEREAVVQEGQVLHRGLVRKERTGDAG